MTETRAAYNVILQPGRELDALVARVILRDEYDEWAMLLDYSTDPAAAMQAWAWLEENNPWENEPDLFLGRYTDAWIDTIRQPAVFRYSGYDELYAVAFGSTYPHAIALAVVEAGKVLGLIDNAPNL